MERVILPSALKPGRKITEADLHHALDHPVASTYMDDDAWMVAGADTAGRLIEVGFRVDGDTEIVFHSFRPCRPQFLPEQR